MRLTRNKSRLGPGPARVLMLAALSLLCVSAMSVSMFALELQTRARVLVQPLQVLTQPAPQQEPGCTACQLLHEPRQRAATQRAYG